MKQVADRLAESFPDDPQALTLAGRIDRAFGDSSKAGERWEKSLRLNPDFIEARGAIGVAAWEDGDFQKAVTHLRQAAADPRLLAENIFCLADSLMNLGKAAEAAALLENAARSSRLSPAGHYVLGQAYVQSSEHEKARQQFEAALAGEPRFANAHYALAMTLTRLGRTEEARKHREEYTRLKKSDMAVRDREMGIGRSADRTDPAQVRRLAGAFCVGAGKTYAMRGRMDEAERHLRRAMILDPQNPEPRMILERLDRSSKSEYRNLKSETHP
jgi:tetratricopeptide (TPR) repeat protein